MLSLQPQSILHVVPEPQLNLLAATWHKMATDWAEKVLEAALAGDSATLRSAIRTATESLDTPTFDVNNPIVHRGGHTPLTAACWGTANDGAAECIRALLFEFGADPRAPSAGERHLPLNTACARGNLPAARLIAAFIQAKDERAPGASSGDAAPLEQRVEALLAQADAVSDSFDDCLVWKCAEERSPTCEGPGTGESPMSLAVFNGHPAVVDFLRRVGAAPVEEESSGDELPPELAHLVPH
jgi:Ankyrin repeat